MHLDVSPSGSEQLVISPDELAVIVGGNNRPSLPGEPDDGHSMRASEVVFTVGEQLTYLSREIQDRTYAALYGAAELSHTVQVPGEMGYPKLTMLALRRWAYRQLAYQELEEASSDEIEASRRVVSDIGRIAHGPDARHIRSIHVAGVAKVDRYNHRLASLYPQARPGYY